MRYLISYDLMTPGKDYKNLTEALEGIGAKRILYSQWIVRRTETTCADLRDWLAQFVDANDRTLVTTVRNFPEWATQNGVVDLDTI